MAGAYRLPEVTLSRARADSDLWFVDVHWAEDRIERTGPVPTLTLARMIQAEKGELLVKIALEVIAQLKESE